MLYWTSFQRTASAPLEKRFSKPTGFSLCDYDREKNVRIRRVGCHVQKADGALDTSHFHTAEVLGIPDTDLSIDGKGNELVVTKRI